MLKLAKVCLRLPWLLRRQQLKLFTQWNWVSQTPWWPSQDWLLTLELMEMLLLFLINLLSPIPVTMHTVQVEQMSPKHSFLWVNTNKSTRRKTLHNRITKPNYSFRLLLTLPSVSLKLFSLVFSLHTLVKSPIQSYHPHFRSWKMLEVLAETTSSPSWTTLAVSACLPRRGPPFLWSSLQPPLNPV